MAGPRPDRAARPAADPATILTLLQLRCAASYWQHWSADRSAPGISPAIDTRLVDALLEQAHQAGCSRAQLDDAENYGKTCYLNGRSPAGVGYSPVHFATTLATHLGMDRQS